MTEEQGHTRPRTGDRAGVVPGVELGEPIGRGGFATVYRGRQLAVDREVAVKIDDRPLDDERNRRRFLREATAAGRISAHPHVVSLIDVGVTRDAKPYLVMELCANGSLADLLKRTGPLRPGEVRDLGLALCSALAAAHRAGILHRDIKPANVLIDAFGAPRLSDFGLAALPAPGQELSVTLEALTPAYASPEAFSSLPPTPQSDVWSMGATLHAMLSLRSPRRTEDGSPAPIDHVVAHLADPLPDPEMPGTEGLMAVISKATAYDPSERYPDGGAMYDALRAAEVPASPAGRVVGGPEAAFTALPAPPPAPVKAGPRPSRSPWPIVAAAVAGLLVGGAVAGAFGVWTPRRSTAADQPSGAAASDPVSSGEVSPAPPPPKVGSCWGGMTVSSNKDVQAAQVGCDEPHYWETYASGQLSSSTTAPYHRDVVRDPAVLRTCTQAALAAYAAGNQADYAVEVIPPDVVSWTQGDRGFACVASRSGDGEVTGSLATP